MSEEAIKIFYSYSREDLEMRNTLEDHLSALKRANKIRTWHDLELEPGTEWERDIQEQLNTADIILLLVSKSFLASEYCNSIELKQAIARHNERTARVIPIILRPCDWNHSDVPFSKLNVLPTHAKAIISWTDPDEAFTIVAQRIRETVDKLRAEKLVEKQAEQGQQQQAEHEKLRQLSAYTLSKQFLEKQKQQSEQQTDIPRRSEAERKLQQFLGEELNFNREVDYTHLKTLLEAGKWQEADQETFKRMCEVIGRQQEGWLRVEDIKQFPCPDLRAIDRLWVKYSDGRFGFSVQKRTWQECGSPEEYNKNWENFGERVGWKRKGLHGESNRWILESEIAFDMTAPVGHLPCFWKLHDEISFSLFSCAKFCKL